MHKIYMLLALDKCIGIAMATCTFKTDSVVSINDEKHDFNVYEDSVFWNKSKMHIEYSNYAMTYLV